MVQAAEAMRALGAMEIMFVGGKGGTSGTTCALFTNDVKRSAHMFRKVCILDERRVLCNDGS